MCQMETQSVSPIRRLMSDRRSIVKCFFFPFCMFRAVTQFSSIVGDVLSAVGENRRKNFLVMSGAFTKLFLCESIWRRRQKCSLGNFYMRRFWMQSTLIFHIRIVRQSNAVTSWKISVMSHRNMIISKNLHAKRREICIKTSERVKRLKKWEYHMEILEGSFVIADGKLFIGG